MAFATALRGFNDLVRSVILTFLSRNRFHLQLSTHCPEMNKNSTWEIKKIPRFLSTGHRLLPSCGCKVCETMVAKDLITIFWGLQTHWPHSLTKPDLFRFRIFFGACSLQNEVGVYPFSWLFVKSRSLPFLVPVSFKDVRAKIFHSIDFKIFTTVR